MRAWKACFQQQICSSLKKGRKCELSHRASSMCSSYNKPSSIVLSCGDVFLNKMLQHSSALDYWRWLLSGSGTSSWEHRDFWLGKQTVYFKKNGVVEKPEVECFGFLFHFFWNWETTNVFAKLGCLRGWPQWKVEMIFSATLPSTEIFSYLTRRVTLVKTWIIA